MDIKRGGPIGKSEWMGMLQYVADLHGKCLRPPLHPFPHPWEEIGTGYCYGPAFGHWDIVHAILDVIPFDEKHAREQIENNFAGQQEDGLIPGAIFIRDGKPWWKTNVGHPPVWPYAIAEYMERYGTDILSFAYKALLGSIRWFEQNRKAEPEGFFYTDILNHHWESGVDEGIRFLDTLQGPFACVDATSHLYALYGFAVEWGQQLGEDIQVNRQKKEQIGSFIQTELFADETGFFHDIWAMKDPSVRCFAFEGMWPVVVGAATPVQAKRVIEENLLNPDRFFLEHPIATVSFDDPRYEPRMWRGPAWNSMTYWAARGCAFYGYHEAAKMILERALDLSAKHFERTGTIWEFYDARGGNPEDVQRKPHTDFNAPCRDYLGHNPLIAMAMLYEQAAQLS